jgi:oligoribonuclease
MTDPLVWIDCEMTGLDLAHDALIEIACLVTDGDLAVLDEGVDLVIKPPAEALDHMPEVVREMHTVSGLLAELPSGVTLAEAQDQVLGYVRSHIPEPKKAPLCGNSIATDRSFIARDMPLLDTYLHYRMVDVSSIKELARRWYPRVYFASPPKRGGHRALADVKESIQELRYYRETVFVPPPGPDSVRARQIAARYTTGAGPEPADTGEPQQAGEPRQTGEPGAREAAGSGSAQRSGTAMLHAPGSRDDGGRSSVG